MGSVYRATHSLTGRPAAVKLVRTLGQIDEEMKRRFSREIDILRAIQHPNVVKFYDSGEDKGRLFVAMEYIDGLELKSIIERHGALSATVAATIAVAAADALNYMHVRRFIRNDVKPNNIMISVKGRVCLIDFGTTRSLNEDTDRLTATGVVIGTFGYMAPEQFEASNPIDHRADIFSFGAVLYEMLTGVMPFSRPDHAAQIRAILSETPAPPSSVDVQSGLEIVTMRCLEKHADDRFQSMWDVRQALLSCQLDNANLADFMQGVIGESRLRYQRQSRLLSHVYPALKLRITTR